MASALREVNVTLAKDTSCSEPHAFFSLGEIGPAEVSDKNMIHVFFLYWPTCTLVKVDPQAISEI